MKPFAINRASWHYKLNRHFFNNYVNWMEQWERKHADFCSYWRATMFRVMWVMLITIVVSTLLGIIGYNLIFNTWATLAGFFSVVALLLVAFTIAAIPFVVVYLAKKTSGKLADQPPGLFRAKYRAWKAKVCPGVDYNE